MSFLRVSLETLLCNWEVLRVGTMHFLFASPTALPTVVCALDAPASLPENCPWPNGSPLAWEVLPSTWGQPVANDDVGQNPGTNSGVRPCRARLKPRDRVLCSHHTCAEASRLQLPFLGSCPRTPVYPPCLADCPTQQMPGRSCE